MHSTCLRHTKIKVLTCPNLEKSALSYKYKAELRNLFRLRTRQCVWMNGSRTKIYIKSFHYDCRTPQKKCTTIFHYDSLTPWKMSRQVRPWNRCFDNVVWFSVERSCRQNMPFKWGAVAKWLNMPFKWGAVAKWLNMPFKWGAVAKWLNMPFKWGAVAKWLNMPFKWGAVAKWLNMPFKWGAVAKWLKRWTFTRVTPGSNPLAALRSNFVHPASP